MTKAMPGISPVPARSSRGSVNQLSPLIKRVGTSCLRLGSSKDWSVNCLFGGDINWEVRRGREGSQQDMLPSGSTVTQGQGSWHLGQHSRAASGGGGSGSSGCSALHTPTAPRGLLERPQPKAAHGGACRGAGAVRRPHNRRLRALPTKPKEINGRQAAGVSPGSCEAQPLASHFGKGRLRLRVAVRFLEFLDVTGWLQAQPGAGDEGALEAEPEACTRAAWTHLSK